MGEKKKNKKRKWLSVMEVNPNIMKRDYKESNENYSDNLLTSYMELK